MKGRFIVVTSEEKLLMYKKSLESAWGFNDYNDWPIKYNSIMHLFLDSFAQEFLDDFKTLKSRGVTNQEIADSFGNPSRIYRIIHTVIYGMKNLKYSVQEQKKMAVQLLDITSLMKSGSVFNEDGKNIIFNTSELEEVSRLEFHKVEEGGIASQLHRVLGILWAYTEALFFRAHDVTKEIHGLYELNDGSLLIREYLNLMPSNLWSLTDLGCSKIKIYTIYTKEVEVSIDAYNHLFHYNGSLIDGLSAYRIEVDDKECSLENLMELIPKLSENIIKIHQWAKRADWREKTRKYAEICWFRKHPLRKMLGLPGEVPGEVIRNISSGQIDERRLKNLTDRQIKYLIYTFI